MIIYFKSGSKSTLVHGPMNTAVVPGSAVKFECSSDVSRSLIIWYNSLCLNTYIPIACSKDIIYSSFTGTVSHDPSPLIFVSLVRHSLLHCHLSHMAYHHHPPYHLHDHHSHLFLLVLSFILSLRLGSLLNHFLHRPSPFLPD